MGLIGFGTWRETSQPVIACGRVLRRTWLVEVWSQGPFVGPGSCALIYFFLWKLLCSSMCVHEYVLILLMKIKHGQICLWKPQGRGKEGWPCLAFMWFPSSGFSAHPCQTLDWDAGLPTARLLSPGCEKDKTEIKISQPAGCYANSEPFGPNLRFGDRDTPTIRKESRDWGCGCRGFLRVNPKSQSSVGCVEQETNLVWNKWNAAWPVPRVMGKCFRIAAQGHEGWGQGWWEAKPLCPSVLTRQMLFPYLWGRTPLGSELGTDLTQGTSDGADVSRSERFLSWDPELPGAVMSSVLLTAQRKSFLEIWWWFFFPPL